MNAPKCGQTRYKVRNFKRFSEFDFIRKLSGIPWYVTTQISNPNNCWQIWKSFFVEVLDKHAPVNHKCIKNKIVSWINSNIKKLIRYRDFHKKRAKSIILVFIGRNANWREIKSTQK